MGGHPHDYDIYAAHVGRDASVAEPNGIALSTQAQHPMFPALASNGIDYFMAWEDARRPTRRDRRIRAV